MRGVVTLVDDDPYVFASTLLENVRLARPDATDDDVRRALEAARLGSWVDGLPDGMDTFVGEGTCGRVRRGACPARRSPGRCSADHAVLVLDEPTAHLDSATARAVTDSLLADGSRRSILWITHGRIGLERMDRVLRLDADQSAADGMTISGTSGI